MVRKPPAPVRRLARPFSGASLRRLPCPTTPPCFRASMALSARADYRPRCRRFSPSGPRTRPPAPSRPAPASCGREMLPHGGPRAAVAPCHPRRWTSPQRRPAPVPIPPPALSVRVGRCRYGSPSVGAGHRPGQALASLPALYRGPSALCCPLPPSVAAPIRTSGGRAAQAGRGRSSAGYGRPGRLGRRQSEASCALPLSGHTTPMGQAAHPAPRTACHGC